MIFDKEIAWTQPAGLWGHRFANARLIAAAPEMAEALRRFVAASTALGGNIAEFDTITDGEFVDALWRAEDNARTLLSKITGEA
jgi:hypothetical protein